MTKYQLQQVAAAIAESHLNDRALQRYSDREAYAEIVERMDGGFCLRHRASLPLDLAKQHRDMGCPIQWEV